MKLCFHPYYIQCSNSTQALIFSPPSFFGRGQGGHTIVYIERRLGGRIYIEIGSKLSVLIVLAARLNEGARLTVVSAASSSSTATMAATATTIGAVSFSSASRACPERLLSEASPAFLTHRAAQYRPLSQFR